MKALLSHRLGGNTLHTTTHQTHSPLAGQATDARDHGLVLLGPSLMTVITSEKENRYVSSGSPKVRSQQTRTSCFC